MSEERLQEIKDSVDFQYKLAKAKCIDNALLFADEEKELIEEIERLNNIIKEVREYIESNPLVYIYDTNVYVTDIEQLEKEIPKLKFFRTLKEILEKGE